MNKYTVIVRRHFFTGTMDADQRWQLYRDSDNSPVSGTREEAEAAIHRLESADYVYGHGECRRPEYKVVQMESPLARRIIARDLCECEAV
jgi:hypothetical protein